ncbi:MAG TPA: hypothetical protein VGM03_05130 [Phycisphaerae bacterium]|jgi:hypothetical protein
MAKQTVGLVERHLEKGVLGITAVAFLVVLAVYGLRSPNVIDFEGQPVAAGEIDLRVRAAAESLRGDLIRTTRERPEIPDPAPKLDKARELLASAELSPHIPAAVAYGPIVPKVGVQPAAGEIVLAPLIIPGETRIKSGRSYVTLRPSELGGDPLGTEGDKASLNWVTIGTLFDRAEQARLNTDAGYKSGMTDPYLVGLAVQRRQQNSDGSWTDWADIKPYVSYEIPTAPPLSISEGNIPGPQLQDFIAYNDTIIQPFNQVDLMRPLMAWVSNGDPWLYPKFEGMDPVELDQPFYNTKEPVVRYPTQTDIHPKQPTPKPKPPPAVPPQGNPQDDYRKTLAEAKKLLDAAGQDPKKLDDAKKKLQAAKELIPQAFPEEKQAERPTKEVEGLIDKADERIEQIAKAKEAPTEKSIGPVQLVWAHDALADSVKSGATYQYRVAFRTLNRYAGRPGELKNRDDATKVVLQSDWSPPSDPVTIEPEVKFFLASATGRGADLKVYKWYEGVWIEENVEARPGQRIYKEAKVAVPGPDGNPVKQKLTFDAAADVIEIDPARPFRKPKPKGGVGFDDSLSATLAMVYRDANGELHERLLDADRNSEEFEALKKDAYNEKAVKKNESAPPPTPPRSQPGRKGAPAGPRGGGGGGGGPKGGGGAGNP